jgi:hypothetical protein
VLPEFQHPKVGDMIGLGKNSMRTELVEPERVLATRDRSTRSSARRSRFGTTATASRPGRGVTLIPIREAAAEFLNHKRVAVTGVSRTPRKSGCAVGPRGGSVSGSAAAYGRKHAVAVNAHGGDQSGRS